MNQTAGLTDEMIEVYGLRNNKRMGFLNLVLSLTARIPVYEDSRVAI